MRKKADRPAARGLSEPRIEEPLGADNARSVLLAAKRLFLEGGFDGVNLARIGKAAGVTRQTVYNLFGSKEGVFRSLVELHWATIAADSKAVLAVSLDPVLSPVEILRQFGEAIVRFIAETEQLAFTRLVISESYQRPWIAEEFYKVGKKPLLDGLASILQRMDGAGLVTCAQPVIAAHQFFGMLQEMVIWPYVMAIGPALADLPPADRVIDEALLTFLSRYGSAKPVDTSGRASS